MFCLKFACVFWLSVSIKKVDIEQERKEERVPNFFNLRVFIKE